MLFGEIKGGRFFFSNILILRYCNLILVTILILGNLALPKPLFSWKILFPPSSPLRRTGIACEMRPQGTCDYSMRPQGRLQTEYRFVPDYKPTDNWLRQGQSQENDACSNNLLRNTDSSTFHSILLTINGQRDPEIKENQLHMVLQAHYQSMAIKLSLASKHSS